MPRREKLRRDLNETAFDIVRAATGQGEKPAPAGEQKNQIAAERGRKGGKKGGPSRAKALSSRRRSEIARKASASRKRQRP